MQVVVADLAGAIFNVGAWTEGALFIPEKQFLDVTFPHPEYGMITQKEVALDGKPYFKYIVDADYTLTNGWYLNGQFFHGFVHERGSENINDYILVRFEKRFLNDALTKMIYLAYRDISKKWTMPIRDWAFIFSWFSIIFEKRLKPFIK